MTSVDAVLLAARQAGAVLTVTDNAINVVAPVGAIGPELRAALVRFKPQLLERLSSSQRFVTLRPDARTGASLTLPVVAIKCAIDFEARGYRQTVDPAGQYQIEPRLGLTEDDLRLIQRYRLHLAAIASYVPPQVQ